MSELSYNGLVVVGKCPKCRMIIWGTGKPRAEHSYCGIVPPSVTNVTQPALDSYDSSE